MTKSLKNTIRRIKLEDNAIISPRLERWLLRTPELILSEETADRLWQLTTVDKRVRSGSFSGSAAGYCERRQMFDFLGVPQRARADTTLTNLFWNGTWVHLRWQMMMLEAGLLDDIEVALGFPNEWNLRGSMDGVGTHKKWGDFIFELKGWSALIDEPKPEHVEQVHRYMLASGIYVASMIYEHKSSQNWREFVVEWDPKIGTRVEEELERLNDHVADESLPDILHACAQKTGPYRSCPYRHSCLDIEDWDQGVELTIG